MFMLCMNQVMIKYQSLFFCICCALLMSANLQGQIRGIVVDENNMPLPYVSIYVQNTSTGTTSNLEGRYKLELAPGDYKIIFQYVGYKNEVLTVKVSDLPTDLDVQLNLQATELAEVVIAADAEDPAYGIIRKAIAKREFYKDYFSKSTANVYVKGLQKAKNIPEKIMGIEVGDLEGALDSNRQGIVYLSESISKLHIDGDQYKEVVISSKISGDDRGYSFNSAKEMEFNFYENTVSLERQMITPIASNALQFYKYKLEGSYFDENGREINEITVTPKRSSDPAFSGTIYIVQDEWNIHSLILDVTPQATRVFVLDTLSFSQVFVPIEGSEGWALFSNTITFGLNIFGMTFDGVFGAVYSDYDMNPQFEDGFFDSYVHVVEEESNKKDSGYWLESRPVPLTSEENTDYVRRDSITEARRDPVYLDSVDRKNNQFEVGDILGGYNYTRRSKNYYLDISSPISEFNFNTVQGFNSKLNVHGRKYFDEDETRRILFGSNLNYGFSENKFRVNGYFIFRLSRINRQQWSVRGGSDIVQFNREEPIGSFLNSIYSLFNKKNFAKFYGLRFLRLGYFHEPTPGVFLNHSLIWEDRLPLENNSDFSFFNKDEEFTDNTPIYTDVNVPFIRSQIFKYNLNATIRFGQKYSLYPDRKFSAGASGPTLGFSYTGAFAIGGTDIAFQKVAASLSDEWELGVGGRLQWYLNGGVYFNRESIDFVDFRHFLGNQVLLVRGDHYARGFQLLPY